MSKSNKNEITWTKKLSNRTFRFTDDLCALNDVGECQKS